MQLTKRDQKRNKYFSEKKLDEVKDQYQGYLESTEHGSGGGLVQQFNSVPYGH